MNVIILHPDFKDPGGVAAYFKKLKGKFNIPVGYFAVGKRVGRKANFISIIFRMIYDYYFYIRLLRTNHYDIIHINPSLDFKSFVRDGIFILLGRLLGKKIVIFFRGWHKSFEYNLTRNGLWLFKFLYGRANAFIVLSEEFKEILKTWGCTQPIYCEVTVIDDNALQGFNIYKTIAKRQEADNWRVLFLARIVKEKGIYETIEAFALLQKKYPKMELIIAGDGKELEKVKIFVRDSSISNVVFTGYVRGKEKYKVFKNVHFFCYPTYHGEGMPNALVESMAFGLPVVTRPVGGIADFFKDGEHGFVTSSKEPEVFANLLEKLYTDKELYRKISLQNYQYAQSRFVASDAALRLGIIYNSLLLD